MEKTLVNAGSILEHVTLSMLMACLGKSPVSTNGSEKLFFLNEEDRSPAFVVNTELDVWYDRRNRKGGNLIDFGMAYWPGLDQNQVAQKILLIVADHAAQQQRKNSPSSKKRKRIAIRLPFYQISETKPIGSNPQINAYLVSQGMWEMAAAPLMEVYYYFVDQKGRRKDFFAAGWQNENGGWEVRNRNFSGCLGKKGMTYIQGNQTQLFIFKDLDAYLAWKFVNKTSAASVLVLNYAEFKRAADWRASRYDQVIFDGEL